MLDLEFDCQDVHNSIVRIEWNDHDGTAEVTFGYRVLVLGTFYHHVFRKADFVGWSTFSAWQVLVYRITLPFLSLSGCHLEADRRYASAEG